MSKKNHPSHFNWNDIGLLYPIYGAKYTHKTTQFGLKYASEVESSGVGYKVDSQYNFKWHRGSFQVH